MNFETLQDLKTIFTKGEIKKLPDELSVSDVKYKLLKSTTYSFDDVVDGSKKPMVIYALDANKENKEKYKEKYTNADDETSLQDRLVFVWKAFQLIIQPADVKFIPKQRIEMASVREASNNDDNVIGNVVSVRFTTMPQTATVDGKIDTGAQMSSLHVDKMNVNEKNKTVSFVTKILSPNVITLPLQDMQAVKTADGGVEYRPVVALNVEVKGKRLQDVLFNLNDRSDMNSKLLIGQNLLEKGKFLIDPNMNESTDNDTQIDWESLQEEFANVETEIPKEPVELSDECLIEELRSRLTK